jgi:acetyl esterase
MAKKAQPLSILLLPAMVVICLQTGFAQSSCNSDSVDPRVAFLLKMPGLSLEQWRKTPIETIRKMTPPNMNPVPDSKMQSIRITDDSVHVVIFRPDKPAQKSLPVIIDFHGGAFVAPFQPWMYHIGYDMANTFNAIVFEVDYPTAPEHRFPFQITASYKALKWLSENASAYNGDTSKLIISGGSSGANIAAVVTLMAKNEGLGKRIKFVSLFCPPVDNPVNSPYASYKKYGKGYLITEANAIWAIENYTGTNNPDTTDYRLFPLHAKHVEGLPPTLIFTAEFDILHDEGAAYAQKLQSAGVPVRYRCFAGELHTLAGLPPDAAEWKLMNDDIKDFMTKYF